MMGKLKDLIQELKDKATDYAVKYHNVNTPRQRYIISEKDKRLVDRYYPKIKALHTIDWEDIVKAMDCLGYHGLGTKLTSKEIEKMAKSITKYINTKEEL